MLSEMEGVDMEKSQDTAFVIEMSRDFRPGLSYIACCAGFLGLLAS
jgi:hypothetical protein